MIRIESAGRTDVGCKRDGNEDSLHLDDVHQLYIVADGMGGHLAGEVASSIVVETIKNRMRSQTIVEPGAIDATLSEEANRLIDCIRTANRNIFQKSHSDEKCRGMGSTVSAIYCTDSTVITANVGDSPVYMVRNGEIELLSVIHTVAAEQAAIDPERIKSLDERFYHMLTRAVGVAEDVVPSVCETPCYKGDIFILCSDGLSNLVSPAEMLDITSRNQADKACGQFVDLANQRGGDDNITVIVLKVGTVGSRKGPLARFFLRLRGKG